MPKTSDQGRNGSRISPKLKEYSHKLWKIFRSFFPHQSSNTLHSLVTCKSFFLILLNNEFVSFVPKIFRKVYLYMKLWFLMRCDWKFSKMCKLAPSIISQFLPKLEFFPAHFSYRLIPWYGSIEKVDFSIHLNRLFILII